jgi:hypothetical protein
MYGCRLPYADDVLSEMAPIKGSVTESIISAVAIASDASKGSKPITRE